MPKWAAASGTRVIIMRHSPLAQIAQGDARRSSANKTSMGVGNAKDSGGTHDLCNGWERAYKRQDRK